MTRSILLNSAFAVALMTGAAFAQGAAPIPPAPPMAPPPPPMQQQQAGQESSDADMRQRMQDYRDARMALMKARRAIRMDQRISVLRRALELTPEQLTLFKPVEDAMRGLYEMRPGQRAAMNNMGRGGADLEPGQRLRMMADRMRARADALGKLADAVAPFRASLNDQQKARFDLIARNALMQGARMRMGDGMGMGAGMGMMGGHMDMMRRHHGDHGRIQGGAQGWGHQGWGARNWGGQGWGGQGLGGQGLGDGDGDGRGWSRQGGYGQEWTEPGANGMYGMGGINGKPGMEPNRYNDMGGMSGMSGPSYNRVPPALDQRGAADQGDANGAGPDAMDEGGDDETN